MLSNACNQRNASGGIDSSSDANHTLAIVTVAIQTPPATNATRRSTSKNVARIARSRASSLIATISPTCTGVAEVVPSQHDVLRPSSTYHDPSGRPGGPPPGQQVGGQRPHRSSRSHGQSVASQFATAAASGPSRSALSARTQDWTVTSYSSEAEG